MKEYNKLRIQMSNYITENISYNLTSHGHLLLMSSDDLSHIIDIGCSVINHRDGDYNGGQLVESICDNNLYGAINHADHIISMAIPLLVMIVQNFRYTK